MLYDNHITLGYFLLLKIFLSAKKYICESLTIPDAAVIRGDGELGDVAVVALVTSLVPVNRDGMIAVDSLRKFSQYSTFKISGWSSPILSSIYIDIDIHDIQTLL